jgi:mono/diheme cytochrome c family protein
MISLRNTPLMVLLVASTATAQPKVDFVKDVVPLFERYCIRCHQPGNAKGQISMATAADLLKGEHVVAGKVEESTLLSIVSPGAGGKKPRMPKEGRSLSEEERETIRRWIAQGADWPKEVVVKERAKADKSWWSLRPLAETKVPVLAGLPESWQANPIDRFIAAKLQEKQLKPSAPADAATLIRRVTFDLTGLPPTPERVAAFVKDPSQAAYAKLVDELLASPAYGERWGRHWLDVVRFGESNGFERNVVIDSLWPFRDYVIKSFNQDKPFDRLVMEHLAGDVLAPGNADVETGIAFLVCGPYDDVGNQDAAQAAIIRANTLDDMIRATGEAFLGVTVGCARCHNHKFDPITQQDYHRFSATLAGIQHGDRPLARETKTAELQAKQKNLTAEKAKLKKPTTDAEKEQLAKVDRELGMIAAELNGLRPPTVWLGRAVPADGPFHVFTGGDPAKKGEAVAYAAPSFLSDAFKGYELPPKATEAERRMALAKWIVAKENPLTPRVMANRLWHYHFGTGLVDTPSDFGYMGTPPSHPELLDFLARQVHEHQWQWKPLHRLIVLSQTYRQSSQFRPEAAAVDGGSRLLWRFPPRRLSGEEVRDAMLSVAGKLDPKMGGPGFRLYRYVQDNVATYHPVDAPGPETYRRGVYHQNARAARVDVLSDFDCPDPASANPKRSSTTTPLQAMTLFNNRFTLDMAAALAGRVTKEAGAKPEDQVRRISQLAFSRDARPEELAEATRFLQTHGLRAYCRAILNANEFLFVD